MRRPSYKSCIEDEWRDEDGYWISLKSGWQDSSNPGCHTIVENTKKEAHARAKDSEPCNCKDCAADAVRRGGGNWRPM